MKKRISYLSSVQHKLYGTQAGSYLLIVTTLVVMAIFLGCGVESPKRAEHHQHYMGGSGAASLSGTNDCGIDNSGRGFINSALARCLANHPNSLILLAPGTYRCDNSSAPCLTVPSNFSGTLYMLPGAQIVLSTMTTSAKDGIDVTNVSGATFQGITMTYAGAQASTPLARHSAVAYEFNVFGGSNIRIRDMTLSNSTGPCFWDNSTTNLTIQNITVKYCSADGVHIENANYNITGVSTNTTGDDGFANTQISTPNQTICGGNATGISVVNSLARGIAVVGGCHVSIFNFAISGTSASGVYVNQESGFGRPSDISIYQGTVTNAGQWQTPLGNVCGIESGSVDRLTVANVTTTNSKSHALAIYDSPGSVFENLALNLSGSNGINFINTHDVRLNNIAIDTPAAYGIYHGNLYNVWASNIWIHNAAQTHPLHRAWWSDNATGTISYSGLQIIDDQETPTGYIAGGAGNTGSVTVTGLVSKVTNAPGFSIGGDGTATFQNASAQPAIKPAHVR